MANNSNEESLPTNPTQLPSPPSLVFAPPTKNDVKDGLGDQSKDLQTGGLTFSRAGSSLGNLPSSSSFSTSLFHTQDAWRDTSSSFGGFGGAKTEASEAVGNFAGTFVTKSETTFVAPVALRSTSGETSSSFSTSNPFSKVNSNDMTKGTKPFGGMTTSSSTVPKLFGGAQWNIEGGLAVQKTEETKQIKNKVLEQSNPSSETGSTVASVPLSTSTPVLFGGVVSSSSAANSTDKWSSPNLSSGVFGAAAVETSKIPSLFGGNTAVPKSSVSGNKTLFPQEASSDRRKDSKIFSSSSSCPLPFIASKTSVKGNVFGGVSPVENPSGNTSKSSSKKLFDKTEAHKTSSLMTGHKKQQEKLETKSSGTVKPKEIPEFVSKSEGQTGSFPPKYHKNELTKLIIALIPDSCMDKEILKAHFEKFGEVRRIMLNPKVNQATVQYNNHHEASKAKKKGKKIHPLLPELKIFYGTPVRRKSEEGNSDAMISKKRAIRTLQQGQQLNDLDPYIPLERPIDKDSTSKAVPPKVANLSIPKKSTLSKKRPTRTISPAREIKDPTISTDGKDLKVILESQAANNYDKFIILKARDKLLRNERTRTSDLKKATYLAATCPDMCPELERYMRDIQNDLSSFELSNGVLDHRRVIKKFSRSSADKDVPLPHELRPGPVLLKTMDFLVCNIINQGDSKDTEVDVWYSYLWNRTRAVRNDLMQQQLTDSVAVLIIERCTRFHIHAAARLCQEPADLFDAKMNTEHLTKSLQTLKELYHDLGERGEYFDTEAEFRAYEMLLNLNDGETIVTQYSKFREEVQKSCHVQFALKTVLAVAFNNYVKFFKLIRSGTYLQGCLLHRYFRQVRSKALDTFMKAYVPSKTPQMPLESVIKTLGFENETDAVAYLRCHGISVDEQNVIFDKYSFIQNPEVIPPLVRPMKLIEVKQTYSLGEVIQGGPIPDNPLHTHTPHNSFDDQGYLKPAAKDASDQSINYRKPLPELVSLVAVEQPVKLRNYELMAHVKEVYNMIESCVLGEMVKQISKECVDTLLYELLVDEAAHTVCIDFIRECTEEEIKSMSCEGLEEVNQEVQETLRKQRKEEEEKRKATEKLHNTVASSILRSYIEEFIGEFIRQICQEYLKDVELRATLTSLIEELPLQLVNEVVKELLINMSADVIKEMTAEQELKVQALQRKICLRKMGEYFWKWRMQVTKARRQKESREMFPADCSHLSISQQNETFGWGYQRNSSENKSVLQLNKLESSISRKVEKAIVKNRLMKECAWHPLFMQYLIMQELDKFLPEHNLLTQYFKVLICTADSTSSTGLQWLRSKLAKEVDDDFQVPLNNYFSVVSKKSGLEYAWAIQEISVNSISTENVKGTSAVLYITSCEDAQDSQYCIFQNLLAQMPRVPFCTIFYDCKGCDSTSWTLAEEDLLKPESSLKLQSLLLTFWKQQGNRMKLVSSRMNNLVFGFIADKFVEPALRKQNERNADGKSPIPPAVLIDLYNNVIDFLIRVVLDEDLKSLEWPPPELSFLNQIPPATWNNTDAKTVADALSHLKLPVLQMEGLMKWSNIIEVLHTYITKISGPHGDGVRLVSHINSLLNNTLRILGSVNDFENEILPNWELHVLQLPWTELIHACVSYKLSGLSDMPVYYQPKKLESFSCPRSWWEACDTSDQFWADTMKENYPPSSRKRKAEKQDKFASEQVKHKKMPSKLLSDIAGEKEKYMEFERKLKSLLEINEF
ncbi:germinal-center associated nuclear protein [Procambarus clarkii]|uniref:germinal-center associated nuclear protein n=1 Tax=Procambarus clarkii TaxID=6728 RepID=UPI001E673603|nr:germinal-center associated nuclear protein-like [Procambarus clarkii]XP_045620025.1 germinal-center associated nuclear protein-like [Procambarus clarkii]